MATGNAHEWTPERRLWYPQIQELALSSDGGHVVYAAQQPLLTEDKSQYIAHLHLAPAGGGSPIQLTFGEHRNNGPRWSLDNRHIAFLSNRSGKANLYVMRADGGEAWALTNYDKTDIIRLRWSPDGRSIAFLMAEPPAAEKEAALKAKDDALNWGVDYDFVHLYTVPFAVAPRQPAVPRQVTRGRFHVTGFDWLPDGSGIAFTHRPNPTDDCWPETRLAIVAVDGDSEPGDLGTAPGLSQPLASPDGRWVAYLTQDSPARWAFCGRVTLYPVDGGEPRPLAYTPDSNGQIVGWLHDSSAVCVVDQEGVTSQLWSLPVDGGTGCRLTDSALHKSQAVLANNRIAHVGQDLDQPNAVYLLDLGTKSSREIARPALPEEWPTVPLPRTEVIRWRSPDGLEIEGIVHYPLNHVPGRPAPLLVHVHGGPTGIFQRTYAAASPQHGIDIPALTELGFVVLQPNPRGSGGYGRDFRFANCEDWGGGDLQDILAGIDHLVSLGVVDPERVGIQGWSYGGFMSSFAVTHTDRFRAACVGAGVTNLVSFNGTSDIPGFLPDYFDCEFWGRPDVYLAHSSVFGTTDSRTPTLILHGDQDLRVPLSQGRELYNVLKRRGWPVELVIYPRQGHGLNEPRLILDANRRSVAWMVRWVLGE